MAGGWRELAAVTGSTNTRPSRARSRLPQAQLGYPSWNFKCHTEASWPQEGEVGMAMMRYMVVVERGETSWGAHVPDLPGCLAVGETREEVLRMIREAIEFHIDGLKQDGLPVPPPSSAGEFVEVGAA